MTKDSFDSGIVVGMLLAPKSTSGTVGELSVTENGTYLPSDSGYDAYNPVTVFVQPDTEILSVTSNGTYTSDKDGYSSVSVNVESSGSTTSLTVTSNGVYTAPSGSAYNPVIVNSPYKDLYEWATGNGESVDTGITDDSGNKIIIDNALIVDGIDGLNNSLPAMKLSPSSAKSAIIIGDLCLTFEWGEPKSGWGNSLMIRTYYKGANHSRDATGNGFDNYPASLSPIVSNVLVLSIKTLNVNYANNTVSIYFNFIWGGNKSDGSYDDGWHYTNAVNIADISMTKNEASLLSDAISNGKYSVGYI